MQPQRRREAETAAEKTGLVFFSASSPASLRRCGCIESEVAMNTPFSPAPSRRQMLRRFANGFGMIGLAGLLAEDVMAGSLPGVAGAVAGFSPEALRGPNPLAVIPPQFTARAKNIIFLFMSGGPSHVDLFDPKPKLA